jgi:hypothetical protein
MGENYIQSCSVDLTTTSSGTCNNSNGPTNCHGSSTGNHTCSRCFCNLSTFVYTPFTYPVS